jgi:hypothetical protein
MTLRLTSTVKARIQEDAFERVKKLKIEKRTNLHLYDEVLPEGEVLRAAALSVPISRKTALVFVDHAPQFNWAHPCEYHLYDASSGRLYGKVPASLPPFTVKKAFKPRVVSFHAPVPQLDTKKRRTLWKKRILPGLKFLGSPARQRYAILFTGKGENRHTNDLEFLYRTLIDVYHFNSANIQVLNHDGTVNYFLSSGTSQTVGASLGNWPGDNTAYRMQVSGQGTRAGFQAALNTIAGQIHSDDFLFIHTNNHGGGPCDPGISDYCMFQYNANGSWVPYYVDDFISDLGVLPNFAELMVMMEQCRAGGFIDPILNQNLATKAHVATAVTENDYSLAGADFDPFAEDWIAGVNGSYPDGTGLKQTVDTNNDGRISAAEAFSYADAVRTYDGTVAGHCPLPNGTPLRYGDTPTQSGIPSGCGGNIFLDAPAHKWRRPFEAIDPLSLVLPGPVYQGLVEKFHPHVPSLSQAAKVLTPAQKKLALAEAKKMMAFAEKAIATFG